MTYKFFIFRWLFFVLVCIAQVVYSLPAILPPNLAQGSKTRNIFLTQTDYINYIAWTMPYAGQIPACYKNISR